MDNKVPKPQWTKDLYDIRTSVEVYGENLATIDELIRKADHMCILMKNLAGGAYEDCFCASEI
ncbi:MAG: hypothetical protein ACT6FG_04995 [Methanosarcinaceae archaeon]